jgi:16S rRNA (guanine527-N7)-methyltransferase
LSSRLGPSAQAHGVALSRDCAGRLARYAQLLLAWNRRINLTGARSAEALVDDHLADALALVPRIPPGARRLVDVGAGAGLPGVILAVVCQGLDVTLLEPVQKKHAFLATVRRELGLEGLHPIRQRWQEHLSDEMFQAYDVAVSRATWPLSTWLEVGLRLVRSGGLVLGLEGREPISLPRAAIRFPYRLGARARAVVCLPN